MDGPDPVFFKKEKERIFENLKEENQLNFCQFIFFHEKSHSRRMIKVESCIFINFCAKACKDSKDGCSVISV
jgi:hypothetical protein